MKTPLLETERLLLRPITVEDSPAIQKYFNDWEIIKNLAAVIPWPYPDDGAYDFIKNTCLPEIERGNFKVWVIVPKAGPDEAIGVVHYRADGGNDGNRGFWLAREFQKRGYMTEAITAMQDYLFFDLKVDKIIVCNSIKNPQSRRIKEKTGAVFLGHCEIMHHSGDSLSEKWEVRCENWSKIRNKKLSS